MGDAQESGFFRGAGGAVFEVPLPLSENMRYQAERGQLVRVNADGSVYDTEAPKKPTVGDPKAAWVGYAVSQGVSIDDAEAMTKNDLVEKYNK